MMRSRVPWCVVALGFAAACSSDASGPEITIRGTYELVSDVPRPLVVAVRDRRDLSSQKVTFASDGTFSGEVVDWYRHYDEDGELDLEAMDTIRSAGTYELVDTFLVMNENPGQIFDLEGRVRGPILVLAPSIRVGSFYAGVAEVIFQRVEP